MGENHRAGCRLTMIDKMYTQEHDDTAATPITKATKGYSLCHATNSEQVIRVELFSRAHYIDDTIRQRDTRFLYGPATLSSE